MSETERSGEASPMSHPDRPDRLTVIVALGPVLAVWLVIMSLAMREVGAPGWAIALPPAIIGATYSRVLIRALSSESTTRG